MMRRGQSTISMELMTCSRHGAIVRARGGGGDGVDDALDSSSVTLPKMVWLPTATGGATVMKNWEPLSALAHALAGVGHGEQQVGVAEGVGVNFI